MHIRPATTDDIPAMMAMERASPEASHWSLDTYQEVFTSATPRLALVAKDVSVAGFLVARMVPGEWEIENIVVGPHHRRRGYGSLLLKEMLDCAGLENPLKVFLEVRESNTAARCLYEEFSFRQVSVRSMYYEHPNEDAIIYSLVI